MMNRGVVLGNRSHPASWPVRAPPPKASASLACSPEAPAGEIEPVRVPAYVVQRVRQLEFVTSVRRTDERPAAL